MVLIFAFLLGACSTTKELANKKSDDFLLNLAAQKLKIPYYDLTIVNRDLLLSKGRFLVRKKDGSEIWCYPVGQDSPEPVSATCYDPKTSLEIK